MKIKAKIKKMIPIITLCALLAIPMVSNAYSVTVTLNMSEKSKSCSCTCAVATVQGGALVGGSGIKYALEFKPDALTGYLPVISGSCASNTSFDKYKFASITGYSGTLRLTESQKDTSNPGIGWGRIDY